MADTYRVKVVARPKLFGTQKFHVLLQDGGNYETLTSSEKLTRTNASNLSERLARDLGAPPPVWEER